MRTCMSLFFVSIGSLVLGQDPTLPSPKMIERLGIGASASSVPLPKAPTLQLAALVMSSSDRGFAIIQCEDQQYDLQLDRSRLSVTSGASRKTDQAAALVIQGIEYHVEDFRSGEITLSDGQRRLIVQ